MPNFDRHSFICLGPGSVPNVFSNGPQINQLVVFSARGSRMLGFGIMIGNDNVALEDLESYMITIIPVSPASSSLIAGNPATIEVTSEDGKSTLIHN